MDFSVFDMDFSVYFLLAARSGPAIFGTILGGAIVFFIVYKLTQFKR